MTGSSRRLPHGIRRLFRLPPTRERLLRGMDEEVRAHLAMRTEELRALGMPPDEAEREALRRFGDPAEFRAHVTRRARRQAWWLVGRRLADDIVDDARYATRVLARAPGFVAVSVLTLGLAIAVGTSLFSAMNAFVFRQLPVPDADRLVSVFTSSSQGNPRGGSSARDLVDYAEAAAPVAALAGESRIEAAIGGTGGVSLLQGAFVTPGYFTVLKARPAAGHFPSDVRADEPEMVLAHSAWQRAFASNPAVIGSIVEVNGQPFRVAAVAPRAFLGIQREFADEFWIDVRFAPLLFPGQFSPNARGERRFHIIGRLRDGAALEALRARLEIVAARLFAEDPRSWEEKSGRGRRVTAYFELDAWMSAIPRSDLILIVGGVAAAGLALLLLASANLASLQMARAAVRRREIATRLALGAGRRRLFRQLVTESAVIAVPGAALGVALAVAASAAVARYRPPELPIADLALDARALLFVVTGVVLTLLVFGLAPAIQSLRGDLLTDLKDGATIGRGGVRIGGIRGSFIVAQVALSVLLTASSAVIAVALARHAAESRVTTNRLVVASVTLLPGTQPGDSLRSAALIREATERLGALPGIEAVSAARYVPYSGTRGTIDARLRGVDGPGASRVLEVNAVRPRYFDVIGLPILRGRDFAERDLRAPVQVAVLSAELAEQLWPGDDPIGKQLTIGERGDLVEILGVVGEQRSSTSAQRAGLLYLPMTPGGGNRLVLHLRTRDGGRSSMEAIARELRPFAPRLVATEIMPMARVMERAVMPQVIAARTSAVLALMQLALATIGLAGIVAFVTAQRRREIGIRSALGASRGGILGLVLRQGARLTAIGGAIGLAGSVIVGRLVATTIPVDTASQLAVPLASTGCFAVLALAAMLWSSRGALALTPAAALRAE